MDTTDERVSRGVAPPTALGAIAAIAAGVGAVVSIVLLQLAGRNNKSMLLRVLMSIWVLGPFLALWLATVGWTRWAIPRRALLYGMMIAVAAICVLVYGDRRFHPATAPNVFLFVLVPPVLTILIAVVVAAAYATRTTTRR